VPHPAERREVVASGEALVLGEQLGDLDSMLSGKVFETVKHLVGLLWTRSWVHEDGSECGDVSLLIRGGGCLRTLRLEGDTQFGQSFSKTHGTFSLWLEVMSCMDVIHYQHHMT